MSDIVGMLNGLAEEWYECCDNIHEPLLGAAAEITRLRAELAAAREKIGKLDADRDTLFDALMRAEGMIDMRNKLLREWRETELDPMDDDYQPWIDQFTARVDAAIDSAKGRT